MDTIPMYQGSLKLGSRKSSGLGAWIASTCAVAAAVAAYSFYEPIKMHYKLNNAPEMEYKVKKGDTIWDLGKAEDIPNGYMESYKDLVIERNPSGKRFINGETFLSEGEKIDLPDVNGDGKVGTPEKAAAMK